MSTSQSTSNNSAAPHFHLDFFGDDLEGPPQLWNILTALSEALVETDCGSSCLFAQSCLPPLPNWEISVDLKNIHNLKVELHFMQWGFWGLQACEAASQVTLKDMFWGGGKGSQVI